MEKENMNPEPNQHLDEPFGAGVRPARKTHTRTAISSRGLLIIAQVVIILIALGIFIGVFGPGKTIRCQRTTADIVDCTVQKTIFGVLVYQEINIPGVLAANLDPKCNGTDCAYALQMYGTSGMVPVDDNYVRNMTINEFLQNKDVASVELRDSYVSGVFIGAGIVFLILLGLLGFTLFRSRVVDQEE
jgi:hypothetical protein